MWYVSGTGWEMKEGQPRHRYHIKYAESSDGIPINLLIAKQRNGPANEDVRLTFLKPFTRFESAAKVSDEDMPE